MKYRMLRKGEKVKEGDQFRDCEDEWVESSNWQADGMQELDATYRRPVARKGK